MRAQQPRTASACMCVNHTSSDMGLDGGEYPINHVHLAVQLLAPVPLCL